jgi:DNA replication initiation complex subunit (GINS family)
MLTITMDDEEITYKTLRKIQQAEKNSPQITQINKEFYRDVTVFLKELEKRLVEEKKPQKQMLLAEESQNIEKIIRNIYEHREKKIMLAAISKARGGNPSIKHLLPEEKTFFDELYKNIVSFRKQMFSDETKDDRAESKETKKSKSKESSTDEKRVEKIDNSVQPEEKQETTPANTHPILRIQEDIPSFVGTDNQTYTLHKGDIISLPKDMAKMLLNKKVSKEIKSDQQA